MEKLKGKRNLKTAYDLMDIRYPRMGREEIKTNIEQALKSRIIFCGKKCMRLGHNET